MKEFSLEGFTSKDDTRIGIVTYQNVAFEVADEMTGEYERGIITIITTQPLEDKDMTSDFTSSTDGSDKSEQPPEITAKKWPIKGDPKLVNDILGHFGT